MAKQQTRDIFISYKNDGEGRNFAARGCGCEFDCSAIEQSYRDAIDQGDDMAILRLAEIYKENGQFRKAAELYRSTTRMMPQAGAMMRRIDAGRKNI